MSDAHHQKLPHLLKLVDYDHPILRQVLTPVQFPLSEEDKQIIRDMKYSIHREQLKAADAPFEGAAGMAANQWGIDRRIFLYCPRGSESEAEVIINPSYEPHKKAYRDVATEDLCWEGCFSVPLAMGNVLRYTHIKAKYQDEEGQHHVRSLQGWEARVWQHENDHLDGLLYEDPKAQKCKEFQSFTSKQELEDWRPERT